MVAPPSRSELPRTMAGVALSVSLGLIGYAGWQAWSSSREQGIEQQRLVRLGGLVGRVTKLDRVADVAVRASAVNADLQWAEQFDSAATEMESALEQALSNALESEMHASLVRMQSAGVAILTRARVALDLADQGRRHAAREFLAAADHLEQQRMYREECSWVETELGRASDRALATGRARTLAALTLGGVSLALFGMGLFLSRKLVPEEQAGADPSADFTHAESRFDEPVLVDTGSVAEPEAPLSDPLQESVREQSGPEPEPELAETLGASRETPDVELPAETYLDETAGSPEPPEPLDADGANAEPVTATDDASDPAPLESGETPSPRAEPTPVDCAALDDRIAAGIDEQTILQEGGESGSIVPSARPPESGDKQEPRAVESEGSLVEPLADEASDSSVDIEVELPEQSIEAELADAEKALEGMESADDAPETPAPSGPDLRGTSEAPSSEELPEPVEETNDPSAAPATVVDQQSDEDESPVPTNDSDAAFDGAETPSPSGPDLRGTSEASISEETPESAEETDDPLAAPEAVAEERSDEDDSTVATDDPESAPDDAETPTPTEVSDSVSGADPSVEELGESSVDEMLDAAEARLEEAAASDSPA